MHESLLLGNRAERLRELQSVLAGPAAPTTLEAALPDLLRDADDVVLAAVATGLGAFPANPSGQRVLETLARRAGPVRAAALRALRGELPAPTVAHDPARAAVPVPVAHAATPAPLPAAVPAAPAAPPPGPAPAVARIAPPSAAPAPAPASDWAEPFEAVLADPSADQIRRGALALLELADARPAAATREALHALAGRLAMASFDHEGPIQQGLARLAKGLKAL